MIRYALACAKGHSFESWFPSSAAYDKQAKRGLVACPVCGDSKVEKAIMAPKLSGTGKRGKASPPVAASDAPAPNTATAPVAMMSPQDARDLHEEGIELHPLPVLPEERN